MNRDTPYWALRKLEDPKQYLVGSLQGVNHLLLHDTRETALDLAHARGLGEWLEAVLVVPHRIGVFSHFILEGQTYSVKGTGSLDRTGWSQRHLQNIEAYLRHAANEGRRDVYDAEEHRLHWLEVKAEIDRRKESRPWMSEA